MPQDDAPQTPQIYLITPPEFELSTFPDQLGKCLDTTEVSCVRLSLAARDEDRISRAADALREVTHARDVALVIDSHILMVERLGLDGVHLLDGSRSVRSTRTELGEDAIIGAFCATSSHDGMSAGEHSADYVSFGPVGASALGDGSTAPLDLFQWWSQMIEVPVVAEGGLDDALIGQLSDHTDFFGLGDEIWSQDDPAARLSMLVATMS